MREEGSSQTMTNMLPSVLMEKEIASGEDANTINNSLPRVHTPGNASEHSSVQAAYGILKLGQPPFVDLRDCMANALQYDSSR